MTTATFTETLVSVSRFPTPQGCNCNTHGHEKIKKIVSIGKKKCRVAVGFINYQKQMILNVVIVAYLSTVLAVS
jgi:hypothetical protein